MPSPLSQSIIASSVLASLALLSCVFRLWIRFRIQRVGWEDIWAAAAFVFGTINVTSNWIIIVDSGESAGISVWIWMFTFTSLLWAVRISIVFSILRIVPARERLYRYGLAVAALFLLIWSAYIVQQAIVCAHELPAFHPTPSDPYFKCVSPRASNISQMAVGGVADTIAVLFPLCVLRSMNLPPRQLRFLRLLFSSSVIISVVCCVRTACQLVPQLANWTVVLSNFQIATCLVVCNIVVIATYLYRVLGYQSHDPTLDSTEKDSDVERDELTPPSSILGRMTLTTVEFVFSSQSGECTSVVSDGTVSKAMSDDDKSSSC